MRYDLIDRMVQECADANSQAAYLEKHYGELTSQEAEMFLRHLRYEENERETARAMRIGNDDGLAQ